MEFPFLFMALDELADHPKETLVAVKQLSNRFAAPKAFGFKINLDAFLARRPRCPIREIREIDKYKPIFADLKMWNGTRTMASVVKQLVEEKVDYLNVYALAENLLPEAVKITGGTNTKVLGLTVLSHYDEAYCQKHFRRSLPETVRHFSEVALEAGCHGIILPGTTLDIVRDLKTIKVAPGVRPSWFQDTRHKQEISPQEAVEKGADILVCGNPIFKSSDKIGALQKILDEIALAAKQKPYP